MARNNIKARCNSKAVVDKFSPGIILGKISLFLFHISKTFLVKWFDNLI
jgi:hypothetical protein